MIFSISFSVRCVVLPPATTCSSTWLKPAPRFLPLVGAARVLDETPHRGHRRHVVLLHDHRQPVGKRGQGDLVGQPQRFGIAKRLRLALRGKANSQSRQAPRNQNQMNSHPHDISPKVCFPSSHSEVCLF